MINVNVEIQKPRLTLEGIVRASVYVVTDDIVFGHVTREDLRKRGFKVNPTNLKELDSIDTPHEFYLIDLYGLHDYANLVDLITSIKRRYPESKFIVLPTDAQRHSQDFSPVREAFVKNIIDDIIYERPTDGYGSNEERKMYISGIRQFVNVEIADILNKLLSKPIIIKIGGSIFDLVGRQESPKVLERLLSEIGDLYQTYPLILTAGGGPRQDVEKIFKQSLELPPQEFEDYSRQVLITQAATITSLLKRLGIDAVYVPPEGLGLLDVSGNYLRRRIPVVSLSNGDIPASESDTHTLSIADFFGIPDVIFAKNTDGIYIYDPNASRSELRDAIKILGLEKILNLISKENEFLPQIPASEILQGRIIRYGFDRDGSLSDNHVIETGALRYLLEQAKYVQRIHIINGTKPELLKTALEGQSVGSYIIKG